MILANILDKSFQPVLASPGIKAMILATETKLYLLEENVSTNRSSEELSEDAYLSSSPT